MADTEELESGDDGEEFDDIDFDEIEDMSLEDLQADIEDEVGFDSGITVYDPVYLPLNRLSANNWNPNEMSSDEFNRLCENIEDDGFLAPIQAVPVDEDGENLQFDDDVTAEEMAEEMDHARIVGGEHRWSASKVVGLTELPVMLVPNKDKEWEKQATVRMNSISGSMDPIQFAELVEEQRKKYDDDQLKHMLGFAGDDTLFDSVLEDIKESVPENVREELEEAEDEMETIEDLSEVLNRIFRENGDQLDHHFITFAYGGEENVLYRTDDDLWARVVDMNERIEALDASAMEVLRYLLTEGPLDDALEQAEGTAEVSDEDVADDPEEQVGDLEPGDLDHSDE
ncbi:ParB N-terminal domain-containing protein (plasmid) [Halorarum halophilum]|uniref:ParB N-terminal domain-containing protein n=1 Tax=Halorarum halophilum TaxID=2743090 RepID=A0A7D5GPS4_9EURY|nr:ParB N-terminal domain-containing protein [Halobaculum halophilum]QLG30004.1 ParB N-terminal domain-containing protein [Halobaculum halophilum]